MVDPACDICGKDIVGGVMFHDDLVICVPCQVDLLKAERTEVRKMSTVSWPALATVLAASLGVGYAVTTWPLVDGISYVVDAVAAVGMALKLYGSCRQS